MTRTLYFDRMLAAQSIVAGAEIVSADAIFGHYPVRLLWSLARGQMDALPAWRGQLGPVPRRTLRGSETKGLFLVRAIRAELIAEWPRSPRSTLLTPLLWQPAYHG